MEQISLLLAILSNRVHVGTVDGKPLRDISDVRAWLDQLSKIAATCDSPHDFCSRI
jgi:hypothetical protein